MIDVLMTRREPCDDYGHKFPSTWVQMAIIAMNSPGEASVAASWIRALNMGSLPEHQLQRRRERSSRDLIAHISRGLIICSPYPVDIDRAGGSTRPREKEE
jgi:hypothetical protein